MNKMAWDFIMLLRIVVIDFLELSIWYFGAVVDHRRKKKSVGKDRRLFYFSLKYLLVPGVGGVRTTQR